MNQSSIFKVTETVKKHDSPCLSTDTASGSLTEIYQHYIATSNYYVKVEPDDVVDPPTLGTVDILVKPEPHENSVWPYCCYTANIKTESELFSNSNGKSTCETPVFDVQTHVYQKSVEDLIAVVGHDHSYANISNDFCLSEDSLNISQFYLYENKQFAKMRTIDEIIHSRLLELKSKPRDDHNVINSCTYRVNHRSNEKPSVGQKCSTWLNNTQKKSKFKISTEKNPDNSEYLRTSDNKQYWDNPDHSPKLEGNIHDCAINQNEVVVENAETGVQQDWRMDVMQVQGGKGTCSEKSDISDNAYVSVGTDYNVIMQPIKSSACHVGQCSVDDCIHQNNDVCENDRKDADRTVSYSLNIQPKIESLKWIKFQDKIVVKTESVSSEDIVNYQTCGNKVTSTNPTLKDSHESQTSNVKINTSQQVADASVIDIPKECKTSNNEMDSSKQPDNSDNIFMLNASLNEMDTLTKNWNSSDNIVIPNKCQTSNNIIGTIEKSEASDDIFIQNEAKTSNDKTYTLVKVASGFHGLSLPTNRITPCDGFDKAQKVLDASDEMPVVVTSIYSDKGERTSIVEGISKNSNEHAKERLDNSSMKLQPVLIRSPDTSSLQDCKRLFGQNRVLVLLCPGDKKFVSPKILEESESKVKCQGLKTTDRVPDMDNFISNGVTDEIDSAMTAGTNNHISDTLSGEIGTKYPCSETKLVDISTGEKPGVGQPSDVTTPELKAKKMQIVSMINRDLNYCHTNGFKPVNGFVDKVHNSSQIDENTFLCKHCGHAFSRADELQKHMKSHTFRKTYTCSYCWRGFMSAFTLLRHEVSHKSAKTFVCSTCGKGFRKLAYLKTHEVIHTTERLHICRECNKSFRSHHHLKRHEGIHNGKKKRTCDECGAILSSRSSLVRHIMSQHVLKPEKSRPCQLCNELCTNAEFSDHMNTHYNSKTWKCNVCGSKINHPHNLQKHMAMRNADRGSFHIFCSDQK